MLHFLYCILYSTFLVQLILSTLEIFLSQKILCETILHYFMYENYLKKQIFGILNILRSFVGKKCRLRYFDKFVRLHGPKLIWDFFTRSDEDQARDQKTMQGRRNLQHWWEPIVLYASPLTSEYINILRQKSVKLGPIFI